MFLESRTSRYSRILRRAWQLASVYVASLLICSVPGSATAQQIPWPCAPTISVNAGHNVVNVPKAEGGGSVPFTFWTATYKSGTMAFANAWYTPSPVTTLDGNGKRWEWVGAELHYYCWMVNMGSAGWWEVSDWVDFRGAAFRTYDEAECGGDPDDDDDEWETRETGHLVKGGGGATLSCDDPSGGYEPPPDVTCSTVWLQLQISYDDGLTWETIWEGWGEVCEDAE